MKSIASFVLASVLMGAGFARAEETKPGGAGYHVIRKEVLGGDGSWDYLSIDAEARRVYIAHESRVTVVDMESCKVVKEISGTDGVHGVAIVAELNRGFTSNGRSNTVTVVDLKTREKIGEVKAGPKPDAIVYDSASKRIFAMNNGGTTATAIDAATMQVVGTVELGGAPEFAVSDGKGRMWANLEDKNEVVVFDTNKLTVLNHWPLKPGTTPTGLAIDLEHRRLFSGCRGKTMEVMDADSGKIIASLPIGAGVDACAFDALTQNAFCSNGDGTLTVVHEDAADKFSVIQTVTTQPGAKTMAFDPQKHQLWLATAETKAAEGDQKKRKKTVVPNTFSVLIVGKE